MQTASFIEITEDHLSHMLNALRTGGKGATVLQAVPQEPKPAPAPQPSQAYYGPDQAGLRYEPPYPPGDPA